MARKRDDEFPELPMFAGHVPLFPNLGASDDAPDHIAVFGVEPERGYIGRLALDADEDTLRKTYGQRGGLFELRVKNARGQIMAGGTTKVRVDPDPASPLASTQSTSEGNGKREIEVLYSVQQRAMEDQRRLHLEQLSMMREENKAATERARLELEASIARSRAESDIRMAEERSRRDADLARVREESRLEQDRQERMRQHDDQRYQQFLLAMQNNAKELTTVMMQMMQSTSRSNDPLAFAKMMETGFQMGAGANQQDPNVEIVKSITGGLESMATLATSGGGNGSNGKRANPSNGHGRVTAASVNEKKARVLAKAKELFSLMIEKGLDPEQALSDTIEALKHGHADEDDDDDAGSDVDERDEPRETVTREKPSARRANGGGAAAPAVAHRAEGNGRPEATRDAGADRSRVRRSAAGARAAGESGAEVRANGNPIPERSARDVGASGAHD